MNYTQLQTRLQNFMEDSYTEFTDSIDTMIENAEQAISRELEVDAMIEHDAGTLTASANTLAKASAIVSVRSFYITVNSKRVPLLYRQKSYLDAFWPDTSKTDVPRFYTNYDETKWQFAPTPKSAYAYSAETLQRITGIASSSTTWIGDNYPDLLFYACCLQGGVFDMDEGDVSRFQPLYERALETARAEVERVRSDLNNIART